MGLLSKLLSIPGLAIKGAIILGIFVVLGGVAIVVIPFFVPVMIISEVNSYKLEKMGVQRWSAKKTGIMDIINFVSNVKNDKKN